MKTLKKLFINAVLLAGLGLVCWGVAKFSLAAGLIVIGLLMVIVARALILGKSKS